MALTRCPGYPKKEFSRGGEGRVDRMQGTWEEANAYTFVFGTTFTDDARFGLETCQIEPDASGHYGYVDLHYIVKTVQGGTVDSGIPEYSLVSSVFQKPLNSHPDYLTKWEYDLAGDSTVSTGTMPTWWTTATDLMIPAADASKYLWVKENSELRDKTWKIIASRTKPGEDGYFIAADVVTEKYYYSNISSASVAAATTAKLVAPTQTFGKTGGNWLVMGNDVRKEGNKWVIVRSYQYAVKDTSDPGWDTDIYKTPTATTTTGH